MNRFVTRYIRTLPDLSNKIVLDIPCGDGRASYEFEKKGATVKAFDMFPEFMQLKTINAEYADLSKTLPLKDNSVDYIICQEGIEHVSDQLKVLQEFNRVLKKEGLLLLTTPNYSHLRARLSRFIFESDYWKRMPPSEIDSIWFSENDSTNIYFGHLFMVGVQKLQTLSTITGFTVTKRIKTDIRNTSFVLGILLYPLLFVLSYLCYFLYRKENENVAQEQKDKVFKERIKLNLAPETLFGRNTFWILKKELSNEETVAKLKSLMYVGIVPNT